MKCILLCAGYATRLFPLTENFPKHLLEIKEGKTILDYNIEQINNIKEIDEVYLITNHRYYEHFVKWNVERTNKEKPIIVIDDHTTSNADRLGAIGDIQYTIEKMNIDDDLIIIAADNLYDYSLQKAVDFYNEKKAPVVLADTCEDLEYIKSFAVAKLDENNKIESLVEKPENPESNIRVWATYFYPKEVVPIIDMYLKEKNNPDSPGRFPQYLYTKMPVYAYCFTDGICYDVGTHDALEEAREIFRKKN